MLKDLEFELHNGEIVIKNYPDADRLVKIEGHMADQLKAMVLHRWDLKFSFSLLNLLNNSELTDDLRYGLWYCAITSYFKCFTNSNSRSKLSEHKVYKLKKEALPAYTYFKDLRDKHIVHDDNAYMQSFVGMVINKPGALNKVADIVSPAMISGTLDQQHWDCFNSLVQYACNWVNEKVEELHNQLGKEYENKSFEELYSLPTIQFTIPTVKEVDKNRM